jgi:hypothetical protein
MKKYGIDDIFATLEKLNSLSKKDVARLLPYCDAIDESTPESLLAQLSNEFDTGGYSFLAAGLLDGSLDRDCVVLMIAKLNLDRDKASTSS